jgi:putative two-component system response regulator
MSTVNILAVDDEPFNLDLIELVFMDSNNINLEKAVNGQEALEKLPSSNADVILLDLRMPVMDGFETLERIKKDPNFSKIPVIVITANSEEKHRALKMGANDFLSKPVDTEELKLRTFNQASFYKSQKELEILNKNLDKLVEQRTHELSAALQHAKETEYEISLRLGRASEYRDLETGMHIKRMSHYSALLGRLWGMDEEEEQLLLYSSPLHDIGKIGIPDAILLKPGKLDEQEFHLMKQHSVIGGLMLSEGENYPIIQAGQIIAVQHHEKYDGTGYPKGIKGEEIHIYARIVSIADVFDALSSKRVYKPAFELSKTLQIIKEGSGTHFDPQLIELFIQNIDKFLEIQKMFPDSEETPHILNLLEEYR